MNIISYNVRGLGRGVKWPAVRRMVNKHHIDMLCIQESKKEVIDRAMCQALWGDSEVRWEAQPSSNTAGGILCLWSDKTFLLERKVCGTGFVMLTGKWVQEAQIVNIINIYSPCDIHSKRVLWDVIKQLKNQSLGGLWCILGDFNCIRNPSERSGVCQRGLEDSSSREFNECSSLPYSYQLMLNNIYYQFGKSKLLWSLLLKLILFHAWKHVYPDTLAKHGL